MTNLLCLLQFNTVFTGQMPRSFGHKSATLPYHYQIIHSYNRDELGTPCAFRP